MSIKSTLKGFIDNVGLSEVFNRKEEKPEALRKPLLAGIDNTKRQFEENQTRAPNRWWTVSNGVVALTVKVKGSTFNINGVDKNHMPSERFPEFLDKFKAAVEAGEFDEELKHHGHGDAKVHIGKTPKATRDTGLQSKANIAAGNRYNASLSDKELTEKMLAGGKHAIEHIKIAVAARKAGKK